MGNYRDLRSFKAVMNGEDVTFFSKPGFPAWDSVTPASRLIAEEITLAASDHLFFLGCGHGAAAVPLAHQLTRGEIWLHDPNLIALRCAEQTLEENQIRNGRISRAVSPTPEQAGSFDAILIDLPKGRKLGRYWLLQAQLYLRPGGKLFLAGSKEMGILSLIKDAQEIFGNTGILGYKKGARLAYFVKNANINQTFPEWTTEPGIAPYTWSMGCYTIDGQSYEVYSLPGVFSQDQLDEGTRLLLQYAPTPQGSRVLDLGCGAGIIGMVMANRLSREGLNPSILLLDSNLLAVASAEKNVQVNQVPGARVEAGDLLEGRQGETFNLILSNPPFHAGHAIDYAISEELIRQSYAALAAGGELVLVANRFIRYNLIMEKVFSNSRTLYQDNRFHILAATK